MEWQAVGRRTLQSKEYKNGYVIALLLTVATNDPLLGLNSHNPSRAVELTTPNSYTFAVVCYD